MATLTWHGHATCLIETDDGTRIVIDPFYEDNPTTDLTVDELGDVDYVLVTHGHFDHFPETIPLAKRTGATVVSTLEIVSFCQEQGVENGHGMNIGGAHDFPFGRVKLTPALHSGSVKGDESGAYTTTCAGFLIQLDGTSFYHAGDSALIKDFELLQGEVDVAMLPIGDNFTMGPQDAMRAVQMIQPKVVIPIHYNTWDLIAQDPEEFRRLVSNRARVEILQPGDSYEL